MIEPSRLPSHLQLCLKKKTKIGSPGDLAKIAAPKTAQFLYNAMRVGPRVILRSAFELLRANTITRVLSAVVLLSIDTVSLVRGRISRKQYVINVSLACMLLVGGTAGWILGSHVVSLILIENVVIGIIAGLIGAGAVGALLGVIGDRIIRLFFKDDTTEMLDIFNLVFAELVTAANLTEAEIEEARDGIVIDTQVIREMFISKDRPAFARNFIEPVIKKRSVKFPDEL